MRTQAGRQLNHATLIQCQDENSEKKPWDDVPNAYLHLWRINRNGQTVMVQAWDYWKEKQHVKAMLSKLVAAVQYGQRIQAFRELLWDDVHTDIKYARKRLQPGFDTIDVLLATVYLVSAAKTIKDRKPAALKLERSYLLGMLEHEALENSDAVATLIMESWGEPVESADGSEENTGETQGKLPLTDPEEASARGDIEDIKGTKKGLHEAGAEMIKEQKPGLVDVVIIGAPGVLKVAKVKFPKLPKFLRNKLKHIKNGIAAKGMRGISGAITRTEASELGKHFVGPNYRTTMTNDGVEILISEDGLRKFRGPALKRGVNPKTMEPWSKTGTQVNFETRSAPSGAFENNVHVDISD
jgi:hypothetical protein